MNYSEYIPNRVNLLTFYILFDYLFSIIIFRAEANIRNVTNEPFSKRTNIRIFVRFDD